MGRAAGQKQNFSVPLSTIAGGAVIDQVKNVLLVFGILGGFLILLSLAFVRSPMGHVERDRPVTQPEPETGAEPVAQPVDAAE